MEVLRIFLLVSVEVEDLDLFSLWVSNFISVNLKVLIANEKVSSSTFKSSKGIFNSEYDHSSVQCNFFEVFTDEVLLFNELYV